MTRLKICGVAILVVATCPSAWADLYTSGDPIPGESWGQGLVYDGSTAGSINLVTVQVGVGGPFELPAFRGLPSEQDWHIVWQTPASASAIGDPVDTLDFELWFASELPEPVIFQLAAFGSDGGIFAQEAFQAGWDGKWVDDRLHRLGHYTYAGHGRARAWGANAWRNGCRPGRLGPA